MVMLGKSDLNVLTTRKVIEQNIAQETPFMVPEDPIMGTETLHIAPEASNIAPETLIWYQKTRL